MSRLTIEKVLISNSIALFIINSHKLGSRESAGV